MARDRARLIRGDGPSERRPIGQDEQLNKKHNRWERNGRPIKRIETDAIALLILPVPPDALRASWGIAALTSFVSLYLGAKRS